jgi:hypothetical protein
VKDFRKLVIWQKSYQITLDVYQVINFVEEYGRVGDAELARFLIMVSLVHESTSKRQR